MSAATGIDGESQGFELAVQGSGAKGHNQRPCCADFPPLSFKDIALQHRFGKGTDCGTALRNAHGSFHKMVTLPILKAIRLKPA